MIYKFIKFFRFFISLLNFYLVQFLYRIEILCRDIMLYQYSKIMIDSCILRESRVKPLKFYTASNGSKCKNIFFHLTPMLLCTKCMHIGSYIAHEVGCIREEVHDTIWHDVAWQYLFCFHRIFERFFRNETIPLFKGTLRNNNHMAICFKGM